VTGFSFRDRRHSFGGVIQLRQLPRRNGPGHKPDSLMSSANCAARHGPGRLQNR
jgi:hypothetical protein